MEKDLREVEVLKNGNRYTVQCTMAQKKHACEWLDKLLMNKYLKNFKIPGQNGSVAKIKIFI